MIRILHSVSNMDRAGIETMLMNYYRHIDRSKILIPNAIEVNRFVFDSTIRNRIRHDNHLENKHIVGHVGRFMSQKNHTFLVLCFSALLKCILYLLGHIRFIHTSRNEQLPYLYWI